MELSQIAQTIRDAKENIILIYAFNATGKTQLSVAYKNETKEEGKHSGVYYNAFSEDIFVWDNDTENNEENIRLVVNSSSLNKLHSALTEDKIFKKLEPFKPKYDFKFDADSNGEIQSISFFLPDNKDKNIKISRGEERIFVWCFYLALFDVQGWADVQSKHFFIDDPVSSLDDQNIFITAATLLDLIEKYHESRKFIITTHHFGFFSILANWLRKGEKKDKFSKKTKLYILSNKSGELDLASENKDVFLYHLHLLQVLEKAQQTIVNPENGKEESQLCSYHFALLRQVLENIGSFLGVGRTSFVLEQIGFTDANKVNDIINFLSHEKIYYLGNDRMNEDSENLFREIFNKIKEKYNFVLHAG